MLLDKYITEFHENLYITAIKKLVLHFPHVRILITHNCRKELRGVFKNWGSLHDVLCQSDYAERVVSIFPHQIKSEYYGDNISVTIEVIALENFSDSQKPSSLLASINLSSHAVFC